MTETTAGILLTGGASRRMGFDKATMVIEGRPAARRLGEVLASVTWPAIEVGHGCSGLPVVGERQRGEGPLVAMVEGWRALVACGHRGPVLVLACDLPLLSEALVRWLADRPGTGSVVPMVAGTAQPLCARWSAGDLAKASIAAAAGARALRQVPRGPDVQFAGEGLWAHVADPSAVADADTPADLDRLGVRWLPDCSGRDLAEGLV